MSVRVRRASLSFVPRSTAVQLLQRAADTHGQRQDDGGNGGPLAPRLTDHRCVMDAERDWEEEMREGGNGVGN